ncbi:MAG: RloB domain-containing protein [Bacteroidota bacterium]
MEFWFLLHYKLTSKAFHNYKQLASALKKHLPAYEKTEKYLAGSNIYKELKPKQTNARNNAEQIPVHGFSHSDVYKILDYLGVKKD